MNNLMKFYGTIEKAEKQEDGTMHVSGYASSEALDGDGEIIKADAIRAAIPAFMKWANVREMHQAKAAGTVLEMETRDDGKTYVKTHIVDSEACKKIEHKVYKGFSVGGKVTERDEDDPKTIKGISLSEISLKLMPLMVFGSSLSRSVTLPPTENPLYTLCSIFLHASESTICVLT